MAKSAIIIEDDRNYADVLARLVRDEGFRTLVANDGESALDLIPDAQPDLAFVDIGLPGMDGLEVISRIREQEPATICIIVSGRATFETAVAAMRVGAFDFISKASNAADIQLKVRKALEIADLRQQSEYLKNRDRVAGRFIGESKGMKRVQRQIREVAVSPLSTVLILGKTGTGKEVVARSIHELSDRKDKPLISVNCAAVPENLLESEFFGHERGAFTGAGRAKKGLFELADRGVFFLDEIGDLQPHLQAKLLRVFEERCFKRVGGVEDISVDVRFIAATNTDLEAKVAEGKFREDLLFRLNVFQIVLPPLSDRGEDVLLLADHFINIFNAQIKKQVKRLDEPVKTAMLTYAWPGNIRQLRNLIEQAMILSRNDTLTLDLFPHLQQQAHRAPPSKGGEGLSLIDPAAPVETLFSGLRAKEDELAELERRVIKEALAKTKGNKSQAAKLLGISRYAFLRRVKRLEQDGAQ